MTTIQRAVVYDCNSERAAEVAEVLKLLDLDPMVIDHAVLMRTVMQGPGGRAALLIGDFADGPNWDEFGAAMKGPFSDVPLIAYGSRVIADRVIAAVGATRVIRLAFPFDRTALIDRVAKQAQERPISVALSNSFGFGGTNASIIFKALG